MTELSDKEFSTLRDNLRLMMCFGDKRSNSYIVEIAGKMISIALIQKSSLLLEVRVRENKVWSTSFMMAPPDDWIKPRVITDHYGRAHEDKTKAHMGNLPLYHTELVTLRANRGETNMYKDQFNASGLAFWLFRFGVLYEKCVVISGNYDEYISTMVLTKLSYHERYDEDKTG